MAKIKIEKKKLLWPWILGLGGIAVLINFLPFHDDNGKPIELPEPYEIIVPKETDLINVKEKNNTVAAYINFVRMSKNRMSLDHAYTNEALLKLIEAANAMAGEVGYDVRADLEMVAEYAEIITKDPFNTTHADKIRKADDLLTIVLENIQKAKYPGLKKEVLKLKIVSESIKPGVLTLDQKDEVKTFFIKAADLLDKMN